MQDKRTCSQAANRTKRLERALLAHLLAYDHPWLPEKLTRQFSEPLCLIRVSLERLAADGLVDKHGEAYRASRAAIRGHELSF